MAPSPKELAAPKNTLNQTESTSKCMEVVISGISGVYPQAKSVKELADLLYNKVNPIKLDENNFINHPKISAYKGTAPDLDRFDPQFFMVSYRTARYMDYMARKILEHSFQAIYDAGVSPQHLNGKKIGVYIASCLSESESATLYDERAKHGTGLIGCNKSMFPGRISYWLNLKGPTMSIDGACCGSSVALEQAYYAVKSGQCEAAIVGGAHLSSSPQSLLNYDRAMKMSMDGTNKSFDENADGCVKSNAVNVMFLQRSDDALRNYATIVNAKCTFISERDKKLNYNFSRDSDMVAKFLREFYEETNISPNLVDYIEGFGAGIPEADKCELESLEKVFCSNRKEPIMIGSVKSNIGYTEAATALCSITKVLLGYETGLLAGNLNCNSPRQDIRAIREGRMCILTDHSPLQGPYTAVNSISFTGINGHILLRGNCKPKNLNRYKSSIPRLINLSGRQENSVKYIIEILKSRSIDAEEIALLHNCHSKNISGHMARGFVLLDQDEKQNTISLFEAVDFNDEVKRPLWFVYSGMGSQWVGMGADLMRIPIFEAAIERCHRVLQPKGIDIINIITSNDASIFDNILYSFVGIAAIQIGLTDILKEIGIVPDHIIGHSVGELGCAYADNCLSSEQMILAAYYRGLVSLNTPLIRGSMAAVGIGYKKMKNMCPPEIDVACHNGPDSSTISGPADAIRSFVAELTANNIFVKEVPCSNIAYHSRYIAKAGPKLLEYLGKIIETPKLRSERWVSTSIPKENWFKTESKYCSADYLTNNLLNPVLFEETSSLIPSNAVLVEIAPHGLLQPILKRSLDPSCNNIAMTKRGDADNVQLVLKAIGRLYMEGFVSYLQNLYPKVEFPVSTGTPMLSHLVEWAYNEKWPVPKYIHAKRRIAAACEYMITLHDKDYKYLLGHAIRGKTVYPFAASLVAVWDTLAMALNLNKKSVSVEFRDVYLHSQPILHHKRQLKLKVNIQKDTGRFEVTEGDSLIITGLIFKLRKNIKQKEVELKTSLTVKVFDSKELYALLYQRDYSYSGEFLNIRSANSSLTKAVVGWSGNWVTFIDSLLQLNMLRQNHDGVSQPSFISNIWINVIQHVLSVGNNKSIDAFVSEIHDITYCGGLLMQHIRYHKIPPLSDDLIYLKGISTGTHIESQMHTNENYEVVNKEVALQSKRMAGLDTIQWVNVPDPIGLGTKVKVQYSGLFFEDALKTLGSIPLKSKDYSKDSYGIDFSGCTENGDRVMGMAKTGACRSHVIVSPQVLWPVPDSWSLEDAATVPFAYACAFYCLFIRAELLPGMNVLVHDGISALGQAVIHTALAYNCQVFATVSDVKNKHLLRKLYPELKEEQIGTSKDDSFGDMVITGTKGKGCEIIISSVKGALKNVSLKCSALNGITFDTVQIPWKERFQYGFYNMTKQRSYVALDFASIFDDHNDMKTLHGLISEGISQGYVRPLSRVTFEADEAVNAFRFLSSNYYSGKILLKLQNTGLSIPSLLCDKDGCHLLICDQEMFGIQLGKKLVVRGAKHLVLSFVHITPSHPSTSLEHQIRLLKDLGADVHVVSDIFDNCKEVTTVLQIAQRLGNIEGIYIITLDAGDKKQDKISKFIDEIHLVVQDKCLSPKYFTMVSSNDSVWNRCLKSAHNAPKRTYVNLGNMRKISYEDIACCRKIIDEMERVIVSKQTLVVVDRIEINQPSMLQKILTIAGVGAGNDVNSTRTLADLGIEDKDIESIRLLLLHEYNISPVTENILSLTINDIHHMENTLMGHCFKQMKGLDKFFSYIESDELMASVGVVTIPSLVDTAQVRDELDRNEIHSHMYIVPGLEGCHERFRTMGEGLKIFTGVLQPGVDEPCITLQELANAYVKVLLERSQLQENFFLVGYESGVLTALEMAAILENMGKTGTIFCIGETPEEFKNVLDQELRDLKTENDLQNAVIRHVVKIMINGNVSDLDDVLHKATTWAAKVNNSIRFLSGMLPHTSQFTRALLESLYMRIKQVQNYNPLCAPLRSRLVHLRPSDIRSNSKAFQAYSTQPIAEHNLEAPLSQAVQDTCCAVIINQYLHPEILKEFESKNHCETYLLNTKDYIDIFE